jgi:peptidoglycan/xylan/chitin deacetylase (PgdA/CDA1 family)
MHTGFLSRDARRLSARLIRGGAILSFHSITTPSLPASGAAHVSLDAFKTMIRRLRLLGELVTLGEFVDRRTRGRDNSGLIAITLDDAYAALAAEFREFVAREAVPLSVFAISRAAQQGDTFWWDRIDDAYPRVSAEAWAGFEAACGMPESYRCGQPREYGPLRPIRQWLLAAYAGRWPEHLEPALRALECEAGGRTVHRSMTFDELAALAELPGVEIGVHTASHPVLPLLSDADLEHEIVSCYRALQERLRGVLPVLAIPYGLFDERVLSAARAAGMVASLTLAGDTCGPRALPHALPRFCVTRSDAWPKFALRLTGFPRAVRAWSGGACVPYPDLPSATS